MTNTCFIRPAVAFEQKALEALQTRAALSNPGDREALLANPDAIELPVGQITAGWVFVAERHGAIAGFSAMLPRPDGEAYLDGLFVEPKIWRSGVGRALVEHCCTYARAQGANALHVLGNLHAENFYEACGFETQGTEQTPFGIGLLMCKAL
jgi:GNAT superfamily N-acetyltransferase